MILKIMLFSKVPTCFLNNNVRFKLGHHQMFLEENKCADPMF